MTEEERKKVITSLKATPVYPRQTEVLPPTGLNTSPTVYPGHPGTQAYFHVLCTVLSGSAVTASLRQWPGNDPGFTFTTAESLDDAEANRIADNAIKLTDAIFERLADKLIEEKAVAVVSKEPTRIVHPGPGGKQ